MSANVAHVFSFDFACWYLTRLGHVKVLWVSECVDTQCNRFKILFQQIVNIELAATHNMAGSVSLVQKQAHSNAANQTPS